MSQIYVTIWQNYHGKKLSKDMEIHHIDGNRKNNNPENLLAVTLEEHLEIHLKQKDHGAVQAILIRMNRTEEQIKLLKESASNHQKDLLSQGKHNFQKISKRERSQISKEVGIKTRDEKKGIHFINSDPVLSKINSSNAGKKAAEKKAGFLNTKSKNHGSNYVKNSFWWINCITGERKRCSENPGINWKKGMRI
jgi:hypothetical protein